MDGAKRKILIVDDNEAIRGTYAEVFRNEGFEVEEASDGLEGLDKAAKDAPDVVFTGIIMPKMDGFGLIEALGKNVSTSKIPVFMSSHIGREEDRVKAVGMGVKDFLVQGLVTPLQVVERVKAYFEPTGYKIRISPNELDAPKLAKDYHFNENFTCKHCGTGLVLLLDLLDVGNQEFKTKFTCPKCGESKQINF